MLCSTTALADTHNEKKDMAKKPAEPPKAAAPMVPPPAPEIAAMAKMMAGTPKCSGKVVVDPMKPTEWTDFKGTFKASLDNSLDKYWIKGERTGTAGKTKMRGLMYMTYDSASKKWSRIMIDNMGMSGRETSTGLPAGAKEGKITWEGESWMMGQAIKGRTTEEVAAKSMKMTSEMSMDGGKKYVAMMEMTCTK